MRTIILNATSPYEQELDRNRRAYVWRAFLEHGSNHSARATTLPYIIRRCEREGVGYVLTAMPGQGYHIAPGKVIGSIHGKPIVKTPRPRSSTRKKSSANFSPETLSVGGIQRSATDRY